MTLGSRSRGTVALVAIPTALMFTFGGIAAAADGDGGGTSSDPGTSVVSGASDTSTKTDTTTQNSAPAQKSGSAVQPLDAASDALVDQCKTFVNQLGNAVPTPTDAQKQAVDAALAQCENVKAVGDITKIINDLGSALEDPGTTTPPPTTTTPTPTPSNPTTIEAPAPVASSLTNTLNCSDFPNQADAQAVLNANPSDPNNLDADKDGKACDASPTVTANATGYPTGAVAAGDGSTGGPWLGLLALLGMGGTVAAAGASKLWFARRRTGV